METTMIGCGLMLAGLAAENFVAHRWHTAGGPVPLDALAILAFALPISGLVLIAASAL